MPHSFQVSFRLSHIVDAADVAAIYITFPINFARTQKIRILHMHCGNRNVGGQRCEIEYLYQEGNAIIAIPLANGVTGAAYDRIIFNGPLEIKAIGLRAGFAFSMNIGNVIFFEGCYEVLE